MKNKILLSLLGIAALSLAACGGAELMPLNSAMRLRAPFTTFCMYRIGRRCSHET